MNLSGNEYDRRSVSARRCNRILLQSIAKKLRELRKAKGISQTDAYIDTDIHVARVETGRQNISVSTLSDLCDYYEISLEEFFKGISVEAE